MALSQFPKKVWLIYAICLLVVAIFVYQRNIPFPDKEAHSSATTPLDIPVSIMTGQLMKPKTQTPSIQPSSLRTPSSYRIPTANSCESDTTLCNKIKFVGKFSDADKRKYQSLIIKLIKNIDAALQRSTTLADTLYSITLDSSKWTRRWRAGSSTITVHMGNISSQQELTEIITHELGHIVDLGILQGRNRYITQSDFRSIDRRLFAADDPSLSFYTISRLDNNVRKASATAMGFVGGYAMSDPFEDFAESFNMYLNHHNVFALLSTDDAELKKKFLFMERLANKKYLQADIATTTKMKDNLDVRPRDTTRGY